MTTESVTALQSTSSARRSAWPCAALPPQPPPTLHHGDGRSCRQSQRSLLGDCGGKSVQRQTVQWLPSSMCYRTCNIYTAPERQAMKSTSSGRKMVSAGGLCARTASCSISPSLPVNTASFFPPAAPENQILVSPPPLPSSFSSLQHPAARRNAYIQPASRLSQL